MPIIARNHEALHIGQIVQDAAVFDFKNWRNNLIEDVSSMQSLLTDVSELFGLLHSRKVDYLLVGGIALLQYIEGRNTKDIDLIVAVSDLEQLPEVEIKTRDDDFAQGHFKNLPVDFLLTRNPLFNKVKRHYATSQPFVEQTIPCATVEGLLLLKLYALPALYRMGNFPRVGLYENDIATLFQSYHPEIEPLFSELSQHLSASDLQAVREIVIDIENRLKRFERGID
jgi:hypothetical protein